jgi:hypothetical protein
MNETSVHVVITDVRKGDQPYASSVVNVPSGAGLARFRAAASSDCCRFVNRPRVVRKRGKCGCRILTGWMKAQPGVQTRSSTIWNHRSRDGGTESRSGIVKWGPSAGQNAGGISHKPSVAGRRSDEVIVSEEAGGQNNRWRSQGPLGKCVVSGAVRAAGRKPDYGINAHGGDLHCGRIKVPTAGTKGSADSLLEAVLGKTRRTEFKRGQRKRRHGLMTICHDARKGRYEGSH